MVDDETTVAELRAAVERFVTVRHWEGYHSPKNLAMSVAIEAAEIMEHFQWMTVEQSWTAMADPETRAAVADEVADVLIYCLSFANRTGIDVSDAVLRKLARNESRFPVEGVRGKLGND